MINIFQTKFYIKSSNFDNQIRSVHLHTIVFPGLREGKLITVKQPLNISVMLGISRIWNTRSISRFSTAVLS